ncbi:LacI family DNA-binding transcriptional regulator [Paracoccus saliphilus]|uniref:LacI family DNA-binding transcriptional regulator n=1 Tax=Paracoccus saliphilus TaxID=405559 RepID=A0AA45W4H3_9RHOB|nr:LacI family DNA-binding transcriptional regulator [Paracoccus saliphilus]WCR04091.1 LacI family DNA-binding transcriptional regulator [Paracoccus saliphilus]SIS84833.1 transcriptional regulator, LacI family [Paracoccus saliphilus]
MTAPDKSARFVSSADVARLAGVSRSAVSRAFTPGGCVSPPTRARILAAAEELGYRVNRLARILHQDRSDLVGVVGANFANPYISAQFDALSAEMHRRNLQCLLLNSAGTAKATDLARLLDYRVRTVVLLSGAAPDRLMRLCAANGARMVLINRPARPSGALADLILADSAAGGRLAAERLAMAGCRHVAVVVSGSRTSAKRVRARAFCDEMTARGIPVTRWEKGPNNYQTGIDAARSLLASPGIDGIFGVTDEIALGVLNTARFELGLRIPGDLSVIGFDDAPISDWSSHRLTTIRQSLPELTRATMDAIERPAEAPPTRTEIPVTLVERDSAAPV